MQTFFRQLRVSAQNSVLGLFCFVCSHRFKLAASFPDPRQLSPLHHLTPCVSRPVGRSVARSFNVIGVLLGHSCALSYRVI